MVSGLGCLIDHGYSGLQSLACSGNTDGLHEGWCCALAVKDVFCKAPMMQGEGQIGAARLDCASPPPAGTDCADRAGAHELCGGFQLVSPRRQAATTSITCCKTQYCFASKWVLKTPDCAASSGPSWQRSSSLPTPLVYFSGPAGHVSCTWTGSTPATYCFDPAVWPF